MPLLRRAKIVNSRLAVCVAARHKGAQVRRVRGCGKGGREMSRLADEAIYFGAVADGAESQQEGIAELRQQLADMTKERDKAKAMPMKYRRMEFNAQLQDEAESLRQQLSEHDTDVKMLRDAIRFYMKAEGDYDLIEAGKKFTKVLAATEPKP